MLPKADRPSIVLFEPEIPGNTGTIGRTCVALDLNLILIKPYGFNLSDKSVRRAGLDYWQHVRLREYQDWNTFLAQEAPADGNLYLFECAGSSSVYDLKCGAAPYLVFGKETTGLPNHILDANPDQIYHLPMRSSAIRSLNLSNAVAAVAYVALKAIF